jgi:hypothetical protein
VQQLEKEKKMLAFHLPGTSHSCKHDLQRALAAINPSVMPQEKVVLAVQKIAVLRAKLKASFPSQLCPSISIFVHAARPNGSSL